MPAAAAKQGDGANILFKGHGAAGDTSASRLTRRHLLATIVARNQFEDFAAAHDTYEISYSLAIF
ncbi:hypothetical protein [Hoeflea olei]|uniref:hypothetical protein n=1 Tax=Hoeflea olei TaxID=1480615 RepID=UPI001111CD26|nr:hypothetical protein [Hoeflea olei]